MQNERSGNEPFDIKARMARFLIVVVANRSGFVWRQFRPLYDNLMQYFRFSTALKNSLDSRHHLGYEVRT
ncbi:hypothetical protein PsorP6_001575 [Peronosclerospora sorghi]|uniref:Uncharacterized protein n=1 Tax=Peronosclerospora sorghi TaxID=230839 RepID=A0ACC0WV27_9STRA|nr:hypothetical protein PsorP6_001575 [Peronosclerospora sorghi]